MKKQQVINSIYDHIRIFGKLKSYKSSKHFKELEWINNYFKNTEITDTSHVEKIYVLLHDEQIHHCPICGKITAFRNFNVGYSKHCKNCGRLLGAKISGQHKKENSPEIIVNKICKECNKQFSYKTRKLNNTINKHFCSKSCASVYNQKHMSVETIKIKNDKTKKTNFKKYGNEYVINSKYTRNKTKEKLGAEYSWQLPVILDKCKETLYKNTGYNNPLKNPATLEKMINTKIQRYGDLLIPMSKYKEYTLPSGKIVKIQGNEAYALDMLLKKYEENDIFVGRKNIENEIGQITYIDKNNHTHIYYPDIYVKSENKIYEVKSQFTYDIHKKINELKKQAVLDKNIEFKFLIIN
jgi:hypothetical protein